MFPHLLKIARRALAKRKVFTLINIFGLSIGITACFFVFQYVYFQQGFDKFHKNADRIYRVGIKYSTDPLDPGSAGNHPAVGPTMKKDFAEVEDFARIFPVRHFLNSGEALDVKKNTVVSYTNATGQSTSFNEENIYVADASFFRLFTFPFTYGDAATALTEPSTTAISSSMAKKYFGNENPLNKTLSVNGQWPLKVTGVFADIPANAHMHFDMAISYASIAPEVFHVVWTWPEFYNYILVKPGADPEKLAAKLPAFGERHMGDIMKHFNVKCSFFFTPLTDIHLSRAQQYEAEPQGNETAVKLLAIIGVFILLIAWINYVNLSTARALERAKEVSLRKIVGASRGQLVVQFIVEALLINFLALTLSTITVVSLFSVVNNLFTGNSTEGMLASPLWQTASFWKIFVTLFAAGVLITGGYPALVLSGFNPALGIRGKFSQKLQNVTVRKALVTFQFALSIILIGGTITVYRQLSFMYNTQLGYEREQRVVIKTPSVYRQEEKTKVNLFKSRALQMPAISNVAFSSDIPGKSLTDFNSIWKVNEKETYAVSTYIMQMDENFISAYQMKLGAGRDFTGRDSVAINQTDHAKVLINETLARKMGYAKNEDAINKQILFRPDGWVAQGRIIGVVKDYHQRSMKEQFDPIVYIYPDAHLWKYISVVMATKDISQTLASLEQSYKDLFPGNGFEYFFVDDYFKEQYRSDQQFGKVFSLFTVIALLVACLGLLGLSQLMISVRTKEIGIRKVLGASVPGLLLLLSRDFVMLVIWAALIAIPVTYFVADEWLSNYAFHVNLNWVMFVLPSVSLILMALFASGVQTYKTAIGNPMNSLKAD